MALMPRAGSGCTKEQKCKFPLLFPPSLPQRACGSEIAKSAYLVFSLPFHLRRRRSHHPHSTYVGTSLLNVPCCDKPLLNRSLSGSRGDFPIFISTTGQTEEYRSKHGDASARPSCTLLPWPPSEHRVVQWNSGRKCKGDAAMRPRHPVGWEHRNSGR